MFTRSGNLWSQQAYLKAGNTRASDSFASSVAISEDTIIVGAPSESSNALGFRNIRVGGKSNSGAAYIYKRSGTTWSQERYLKASNTGVGDQFGISVAVSGDTIVVGANGESSSAVEVGGDQADDSAKSSGAAYVFTSSGTSWSQQAYLKASNTGAEDYFGGSVAISGDTIVVGAGGEDSNATGVNGNQSDNSESLSGAAYVFTRSGMNWSQQAYLKASNTGRNDVFGASVAVSGGTIIAGAPGESSTVEGVNGDQSDNSQRYAGAAYVFNRSGMIWSQQAYLKATSPGFKEFSQFGSSVAVFSTTMIVGARAENGANVGVNSVLNNIGREGASGAAYIFTYPPTKFRIKIQRKYTFGKVTGAGSFTDGSTVTLTAKPKKGHKFVCWFEGKKLISKRNKLVIANLTANRTLEAKFK